MKMYFINAKAPKSNITIGDWYKADNEQDAINKAKPNVSKLLLKYYNIFSNPSQIEIVECYLSGDADKIEKELRNN